MDSFQHVMNQYHEQLAKGAIQKAYRGLMEYIMNLRTHFMKKYPDFFVSGSIYYGYMDMTYFSFTPRSIKDYKLKIALVFIHEEMRFEAWLAAANKQLQEKYWKLIKESSWNKYHLVSTTQGVDSIVESVLVDDPDFDNLDALTDEIERESLKFIRDIEDLLPKL